MDYKTDWVPGQVMEDPGEGPAAFEEKKKKFSEAIPRRNGRSAETRSGGVSAQAGQAEGDGRRREIRKGLEELIPIVEKIFARGGGGPGSETEIKRLTDRYLPMIINSTESYLSYAKKNITGEDMDDLKEEVISGIALVTEACTNLLNRLYEDGIVDASTDISVLKMMLKQDGLLGSDIRKVIVSE